MTSPWTDITKAPPPIGKPVLVKWQGGGVTVAMPEEPIYPHQLMYFETYGIGGYDCEFQWEDGGAKYQGVTHWMPMPDDPQEQPR